MLTRARSYVSLLMSIYAAFACLNSHGRAACYYVLIRSDSTSLTVRRWRSSLASWADFSSSFTGQAGDLEERSPLHALPLGELLGLGLGVVFQPHGPAGFHPEQ